MLLIATIGLSVMCDRSPRSGAESFSLLQPGHDVGALLLGGVGVTKGLSPAFFLHIHQRGHGHVSRDAVVYTGRWQHGQLKVLGKDGRFLGEPGFRRAASLAALYMA